MISWLQNNLQKHFRFVFIILLAGVIVAFVFTIGAGPGIGDGRNRSTNLSYFGNELNTEAERQEFFNAAFYSALLQFGSAQINQDQLNQYAFNRGAAVHLADLHNVPGPTGEQLSEHIQELGMFLGADGQFSAEAYTSFRDQTRASGQISEGALSQIIADDYRVNRVYESLSQPGFVLESEVLDELVADQTKWTINVATFNFENFKPEIDAAEEKLETFFAANSFRYTSPTRRVISYIEFKALDFIEVLVVDEKDLKNYFARNASKYTKTVAAEPTEPREGEPEVPAEPTTEPASFEEAKSQVTSDYKLEQAQSIAQAKAEEHALAFVEADNASGTDSLDRDRIEALIETKGYESRQTTAFARNETPIGLNWSQNLVALSYQLSEGQIYSQPVVEGESTFVLYLQDENPEFVPHFNTARNRVIEDYSQEEFRRLKTIHGEELAAALKATSDEDAFKAKAENKGLVVAEFADFTRREPAEGLDTSLLYAITDLNEGDVSDASIREENGTIIHVSMKEVPEVSSDADEYESRMAQLKANYERYAVAQYISKLSNAELIRSGLASAN